MRKLDALTKKVINHRFYYLNERVCDIAAQLNLKETDIWNSFKTLDKRKKRR